MKLGELGKSEACLKHQPPRPHPPFVRLFPHTLGINGHRVTCVPSGAYRTNLVACDCALRCLCSIPLELCLSELQHEAEDVLLILIKTSLGKSNVTHQAFATPSTVTRLYCSVSFVLALMVQYGTKRWIVPPDVSVSMRLKTVLQPSFPTLLHYL